MNSAILARQPMAAILAMNAEETRAAGREGGACILPTREADNE
jgi:hypothetical protein